jgi:hypothetical protein
LREIVYRGLLKKRGGWVEMEPVVRREVKKGEGEGEGDVLGYTF